MDHRDLDENPDARRKASCGSATTSRKGTSGLADASASARRGRLTALPAADYLLARLAAFGPPLNVHKNAGAAALPIPDSPRPDYVLKEFGDLLEFLGAARQNVGLILRFSALPLLRGLHEATPE